MPLGILAILLNNTLTNPGDDVAKTAAEAKPLAIGASAPSSKIRTIEGKEIEFKNALGGKKTIVVFYRGGWCPFCNQQLADLMSKQDEFKARGYQLFAISPDTPLELKKSADKQKLDYSLFSDSNADLMKKFGVAFRVDDQTFNLYRDKFNLDLEKASGKTHHILPVPSVYVISEKGKITYSYSNPDYKVRLKASELISKL